MAPTDATGAEDSATETEATDTQNATEQPQGTSEAPPAQPVDEEPAQDDATSAEGDAGQAAVAEADAATKALIDRLTPIIQAEVQKATATITDDLLVIVRNLEVRIEASAPAEIARLAHETKAAVDALAARLKHMI